MFGLKAKILLGLIIVAGVLLGIWRYGADQYDAGYAAAEADVQKQTDKAVKEATQRVRDDMQRIVQRKEKERLSALQIAEELQRQQDEVTPNEIIKTVEVNSCKRLGADVMRLYNRINGSDRSRR